MCGFGLLATHTAYSSYRADSEETGHLIFGWGTSRKGQLGQGHDKEKVDRPLSIADLDNMRINSLAASGELSAAVTSQGELYTWGSAKNGAQVNARGAVY